MNGRARGTRSPRRRWAARLTAVALVVGVVTAPAGAAAAATHSSSHFSGELRVLTSEPCLGGAWVELWMRWSGTIRWTDWDDDGSVDQLKLDMRADVQMTSLNGSTPSYKGRLGASLSQVTNGKTYAETLVIHSSLRGDDRSHLAIRTVVHVTSDANGYVRSSFDRPRC